MLIALKKHKGVIPQDFVNHIKNLEDGTYIVKILSLQEKGVAAYRRQYRHILDTISFTTGERPQEIHQRMKAAFGVESTAGESLSPACWIEYIENVKMLTLTQIDLIL